MPPASAHKKSFVLVVALLGLTTAFSYATYFHNYTNPAALFWDENYHLTSAQKYLNGIFFMQSHPPLGKQLIALGEYLVDANPGSDDQFLDSDYTSSLPDGFSFAGYRLLPALLAWLTAPLIFLMFLLITRRPWIAFFLSFLYVFDNALIVHNRGAMLESPLLFFSALTIVAFQLAIEWKRRPALLAIAAFLFGVGLGCAFGTKLVGLIFILLGPAGIWILRRKPKLAAVFVAASAVGFLATTFVIWQVHFSLGKIINPKLESGGYYRSNETTRGIIDEGQTHLLRNFPAQLYDHLRFAGPSNTGVPKLDLCKVGENGSPTIFWPFGARSINYRWNTPDGQSYQYLYLQVNPVAWWLGATGVLLGVCLLAGNIFLGTPKWNERMTFIAVFIALYAAYMIAMIRIEESRVMYLYHYFTPLLMSFALLGAAFMELQRIGSWKITEDRRLALSMILGSAIVLSFLFYSPLTYYRLIDDAAFKRRMIFPLWDLRCVNCPMRDHFYIQKGGS